MIDSDYIVCMRGGGNFSIRFYESLCMGRIPIFVDTDCILPFDNLIDYRKFCIWIEKKEIPMIVKKVLDFHKSLSLDEFEDLQIACRKLWVERLCVDSFYKHLSDHFLQEGTDILPIFPS